MRLSSARTIYACSRLFTPLCTQTINVRQFSNQRLYTEKHEWISVKDGDGPTGRVGISQHAQDALGDVVFVQLPDVGSNFKQFDEVGAIESVKAASELMTPVSGEVTTVNDKLEGKPGLVNSSCYEEGWLFEIKLTDKQELDKLMTEEKYKEYLETSSSGAV